MMRHIVEALNMWEEARSGRDWGERKEAGLTLYYVDGTTAFGEANMSLFAVNYTESGNGTTVLPRRRNR